MKSVIFGLILTSLAFSLTACDVDGEIRQGSVSSSISPNSGAAGGNSPVLGGVYFDSLEGLTISQPGTAGQTLILNSLLEPVWVTAVPGGALPTSGGTMTGNIELNGNFLSGDSDNEGIFVDSFGNVAIGTTIPLHKLHVEGTAGKTAGGSTWTVISDQRLKKDILPLSKGLKEINDLKVKTFTYVNNKLLGLKEHSDVGLIAQDVASIFPEAIVYSGQYMMLDYHPIYMTQIRAIQELSEQNKKLEQRISALESKLDQLLK